MPRPMLQTAIEGLKFHGATPQALYTERSTYEGVIRRMVDDKGYNHRAVIKLAQEGQFGNLVQVMLTRTFDGTNPYYGQQITQELGLIINEFSKTIDDHQPADLPIYRSQINQITRIDKALGTRRQFPNSLKGFYGEGAATSFGFEDSLFSLPKNILSTPIAIIGFGMAGITVAFALDRLGFKNITVFDRTEEGLGIWARENVYGRSRNNPKDIEFFDNTLNAAPGEGEEVKDFLETLIEDMDDISITQSNIQGVTPGDLRHTLRTQGLEQQYAIVINAIGLGAPVPLSDPDRMLTSANSSVAGPRWQVTLDRKKIEGKRLVLIGLGNSTAEMLRQIHDFQDNGVDVDYQVLTHYPKDAVFNPNDTVYLNEKPYRVFRDISKPNLVDFQGDLPDSRYDYYRALNSGRIQYGVRRWEMSDSKLVTFTSANKPIDQIECSQVYTLTGYKHSREVIERMGCRYDPSGRCAMYDYDGEMLRDPLALRPEDRLCKGYFGFGAMLDAPHNRNAIVLPGMIHRIGDLLFGIVMRATEFQLGRV
jgi:hypothetical protein